MRKGYKVVLCALFLVLIQSCKKEIEYKKLPSGLEYHYFHKADTGMKGKPGDYYLIDMIGQREDDSVFIDSYKLGQKIKMVRTRPPFHSLFNDALGMLKIGDSLIFRMRADSFFYPLHQPVPGYLKASELIRFTVSVKDILDPQAHLLKMYEYEYSKMEEYLGKKGWNYATDTATGIKYEVVRKGNGVKAVSGDEVEVSYLLTYLDGTIINRTKPGDKMVFQVGSTDYIPGLSKVVLLNEEGSKIQAIIPFAEGFGESGSAYVDPYATLIIEMDILKVIKKK